MSKSVGNTLVLHELLDLYPPEVLRFVLLKAHYRQPLDWSESALQQARATLDGWYGVLRDLAGVPAAPAEVPADFEAALLDDLNTPDAFATLAALADAARRSAGSTDAATAKGRLLAAAGLIGLLQQDPEAWFKQTAAGAAVDAAHVDALIAERNAARAARDFARADAIRTELTAMNITIEDGAQGTRWRVGA